MKMYKISLIFYPQPKKIVIFDKKKKYLYFFVIKITSLLKLIANNPNVEG